ncbi:MAG: molybdenum cofactor biosynthesis protein MoaE [bacterium]|nr:molybdenum cofactor biosynthesis protein MoaE [Candidatus Kapabacteria bacterium]
MVECRVVEKPIDVCALLVSAADDRSGATSLFVGTARNSSSERIDGAVTRLEYEAYVPMAEQELNTIALEAEKTFKAIHVIVHHRVGVLALGEAAVAVVVSTAHRAASFDACRYIIEELKQRAPIWKKEVFVDGAEWVNARP